MRCAIYFFLATPKKVTVAQYTRAKYTSARSEEEKSWVALDMLAHPHQ